MNIQTVIQTVALIGMLTITIPVSQAQDITLNKKMMMIMNASKIKVNGNWLVMATQKFETTVAMKNKTARANVHLNLKLAASINSLANNGNMLIDCTGMARSKLKELCSLVGIVNGIPIVLASYDHTYGKFSSVREYHLGNPRSNYLVMYRRDPITKTIWLLGLHTHDEASRLYGRGSN